MISPSISFFGAKDLGSAFNDPQTQYHPPSIGDSDVTFPSSPMLMKMQTLLLKLEAQFMGFQISKLLVDSREISTIAGVDDALFNSFTLIASDEDSKCHVIKHAVHKIAKRTKQMLKKSNLGRSKWY
jgi:hypothetical protein